MTSEHERYGVLGAGMLGMTIALRLAQAGLSVEILEAAPESGGLTAAWRHDGLAWDRFYHVIEASDRQLLGLLGELGLEPEISWGNTKTRYYDGKGLYPLDNAMDWFALPALGLVDKIRIAINILRGAYARDLGKLENLEALSWLKKWSGERAVKALWLPLLRAKLGDNAPRASAAYIAAVMQRFYGARQGVSRTELFATVRGGYAKVLGTLQSELQGRGVGVKTAVPVLEIKRREDGLSVRHEHGEHRYNHVISTINSDRMATIAPDMSTQEKESHAAITYQGVVCPSLLLRQGLAGAYLTYLTDGQLPFTTIIEMSSLVDPVEFGGHHLVYLPRYVPADDPLFEVSDDIIIGQFFDGLKTLYPSLSHHDLVLAKVARARQVLALPEPGYRAALPAMHSTVMGLTVCNSAQILNASLSVEQTVALANRCAGDILDARA